MVKFHKDYKEAVPVLNRPYKEEGGQGYFHIEHKSPLERTICWIFRIPREKKIYLDVMSAKTVSQIDGKRTIAEIAAQISENPENFEEYTQRVALFLDKLHQKRFVSIQRNRPQ